MGGLPPINSFFASYDALLSAKNARYDPPEKYVLGLNDVAKKSVYRLIAIVALLHYCLIDGSSEK